MSASQPNVAAGQVWEEVDPRVDRKVVVLSVTNTYAMIRNVKFKSGSGTRALLSRFHGKRCGYRFVSESAE